MTVLTLDERRRITLPKRVVDDPKQKFVAIKTREGILLKPLPKDPIKALQKEGEKLKGVSFHDLKRAAEEQAYEEIEEKLKKRGR